MSADHTTIHVRVHPEVKETLDRLSANLEQMNDLLRENQRLLAECLKGALWVTDRRGEAQGGGM
ncbi:hypothetical protein [Deferrisoma camini]|uniref:hypothetical protein n=1 Tax=Deferrisoma camini TaxID=1035120 RepID=UPI00046CE0D6|nr:hypothetical protein [Deferrisoma camini]